MNNMQMNMNIPNPNTMQMMQMQMMMNMMNGSMESDPNQWTLIFEEREFLKDKRTDIKISPDKTVREAINLYKIKSNKDTDKSKLVCIFNSKKLNYNSKINESGLVNGSIIAVIDPNNLIGG